jgi:hypothetical protein
VQKARLHSYTHIALHTSSTPLAPTTNSHATDASLRRPSQPLLLHRTRHHKRLHCVLLASSSCLALCEKGLANLGHKPLMSHETFVKMMIRTDFVIVLRLAISSCELVIRRTEKWFEPRSGSVKQQVLKLQCTLLHTGSRDRLSGLWWPSRPVSFTTRCITAPEPFGHAARTHMMICTATPPLSRLLLQRGTRWEVGAGDP